MCLLIFRLLDLKALVLVELYLGKKGTKYVLKTLKAAENKSEKGP